MAFLDSFLRKAEHTKPVTAMKLTILLLKKIIRLSTPVQSTEQADCNILNATILKVVIHDFIFHSSESLQRWFSLLSQHISAKSFLLAKIAQSKISEIVDSSSSIKFKQILTSMTSYRQNNSFFFVLIFFGVWNECCDYGYCQCF